MNVLHALAFLVLGSTGGDSAAGWEHIKALVGEWEGAANDGRKIRHSVELIAGGSVVMERSWFEAHPGEMMVTMYHLDRGKLMLTHYCVAKNQPRLEATEISPDGGRVLFSFRDATNLVNRDKGHMDKAEYTFIDKDNFKSRWTWYQDGKERWMEEFTYQRVHAAPSGNKVRATGQSVELASCCAPSKARM